MYLNFRVGYFRIIIDERRGKGKKLKMEIIENERQHATDIFYLRS